MGYVYDLGGGIVLNYGSIRNLYKSIDSIKSEHLITAEWNMNKYSTIEHYGLYKSLNAGARNIPTVYTEADPYIISGDNHIIYDDDSIKKDPRSNYFSKISSVFQPNRPNPGIVYIQKFDGVEYSKDVSNIRVSNLSTASARFYPVAEEKTFDYFNSAKFLGIDEIGTYKRKMFGVTNGWGLLDDVNPFVVYDEDVLCNKIVIKVQNHISIPSAFAIDILVDGSWVQIYNVPVNNTLISDPNFVASSTDDFRSGELSIYLQSNGTWSKTINRLTDFNQLESLTPTQFKKIRGIRFRVSAMANTYLRGSKKSSLELIEISPRLEADISEYVESFSINSSIGDSTSFGLPVGTVVSGNGSIIISNEEEQFLFASVLSSLKMLNEDVKFNFYQKVFVPGDNQTYNLPLGVLYSSQWNIGEDYSVSVNLEDGMKYLRQLSAPDFMISAYAAMSSIILMILDNVGVTGLEFKKSSDSILNDKEDTRIKNFFCKNEETVAEVLEKIAIATQCSMFYDVSGKLNVLTKERLTQNARIEQSIGPSEDELEQRTDFWFVMDENVNSSDPERFYLSGSYVANVISLTEEKINPITDGDITYHFYGPKKEPILSNLKETRNELYDQLNLDQLPLSSLAFSNYDYGTTIMWRTADDSTSVLGAANIIKDIYSYRLKDMFEETYTAFNEEDAIRQMYENKTSASARQSLIIYMDINEGLTFPDYEGFVLVDNEYIKYKGKLFYLAGTNGTYGYKVIFTNEEFFELQSGLNKGDSISFRGLVIDVKFKIIGKNNDKYQYVVVGDGRGRFNSEVSRHYSVLEESDGVDPEKRFKLTLGETSVHTTPGSLDATTKFDFIDKIKYRSAKKFIGTLPPDSLKSYLGFLKISGPRGPQSDTDSLESIVSASASKTVTDKLKKINRQVDSEVPGNFDDYIYLQGERNIYGQRITLPFSPNFISTRMRLYSPRKKVFKDQTIMSTNSSIAGIGFGINSNREGYFLEVESAGSGKDFVEKEAVLKNLRFYKVSLKKNEKGNVVLTPEWFLKASVGAFTVFDTAVQVIKTDNNTLDPVFELSIQIKKDDKNVKYSIYYGDTKIGDYIESLGDAINVDAKNIFMFVRNDSQAIYEYLSAAARPLNDSSRYYFRNQKQFEKRLEQGIIPVNQSFLFKDDKNDALFYYNDFAKLARQVREYKIRFANPALTSALLDISEINPKYLIKNYSPTPFGAKIVVVNISGGALTLGAQSKLPLYIVGIGLEELSTGRVTAKDMYNKNNEDDLRKTDREKNISIYGDQTFSLDSQYIQDLSQARSMMQWVLKYCGRQRLKLSMEVFENPLIELGDKVKVFDKSRGYFIQNSNFGQKTFVVSSVSRSVNNSNVAMIISLTEVGES